MARLMPPSQMRCFALFCPRLLKLLGTWRTSTQSKTSKKIPSFCHMSKAWARVWSCWWLTHGGCGTRVFTQGIPSIKQLRLMKLQKQSFGRKGRNMTPTPLSQFVNFVNFLIEKSMQLHFPSICHRKQFPRERFGISAPQRGTFPLSLILEPPQVLT